MSGEERAVADAPEHALGRWAGWCAAAAAALFLAFSGWQLWQAETDDDLAYAAARDTVLDSGKRHLETLNSVRSGRIEDGLARWRAASTGPLRDELRRTGRSDAATLAKAGTTARAKVTDAAVVRLDTRSGTAELIATVHIRVTERGGAPTTDRKRLTAGLERTGDGWKLRALGAVPAEGAEGGDS